MSDKRRRAVWAMVILGVLLVGLGLYQLRTLTWQPATGTVGACRFQAHRDLNGSTSRHYTKSCAVTWTDAAGTHTDDGVGFGDADVEPGKPAQIVVSGDSAEPAGTSSEAPLYAGGGVLLLIGAVVFRVRAAAR
ncbi:hypothetical protein [Dactylosporangium sp. CS-033363]|uniref:hypothetical protein n=1 Tax=Dactylosporangium sp. CS-033363 TaxID=3239935 RepID=UPI003D8CF2B2